MVPFYRKLLFATLLQDWYFLFHLPRPAARHRVPLENLRGDLDDSNPEMARFFVLSVCESLVLSGVCYRARASSLPLAKPGVGTLPWQTLRRRKIWRQGESCSRIGARNNRLPFLSAFAANCCLYPRCWKIPARSKSKPVKKEKSPAWQVDVWSQVTVNRPRQIARRQSADEG
jgi:hypothetical protein